MKTIIAKQNTYICGCEAEKEIVKANEVAELLKQGYSVKEVYVSNNIRYVTVNIHDEHCCDYCTGSKYLEPVDFLFHNMILSHGIATGYSGNVDAKEIVNRFLWLNNACGEDVEICCSHKSQRIGGIGVYVKGYNSVVSNIDLFSSTGMDGRKYFQEDSWRTDGIVFNREDYSLNQWDHTEHIVYPDKIIGVWIKEWFLTNPEAKELAETLKQMCREHNMVFHVCKNRK